MRLSRLLKVSCGIAAAALLGFSCGKGSPTSPGEDDLPGGDVPGFAPVTVRVVNRLFSPVDLFQDGKRVATVSRLDSADVDVLPLPGTPLRWTMEAVTGRAGDKLGETLAGHFVVENLAPGERRLEITNCVGDAKYFAILIGNTTGAELMLGVNMGLGDEDRQWESRCFCPLPAESPLIYVGYYRLLAESNIRVYRYGPEYSGPYDTWVRFADQIDDRSGIVLLNVYAIPAGAPSKFREGILPFALAERTPGGAP